MIESVLALLTEMRNRAQADPRLREEWNAAWKDFSAGRHEPAAEARFAEWFLLERESSALGSVPAVAWAPAEVEEDSAWERLLDSFLGIFQQVPGPASEPLQLEDLWSGRIISAAGLEREEFEETTLAIGRFLLADDFHHQALPGLILLTVPGLPEALERDLAASRARQPRQRLSQAEIEQLLAPFRSATDHARHEAAERRLGEILQGCPGWTLERLAQSLNDAGLAETLDVLAFDTEAELEEVRRLLPDFLGALQAAVPAEAVGEAPAPAALDPAAAVARFESQRDQGRPLEAVFGDLEEAFGLPRGSTREKDFESAAEPVGSDPLSLAGQLECYAWESSAREEPLAAQERAALADFGAFLEPRAEQPFDLRNLGSAQVCAYLLRTAQPGAVQATASRLRSFLEWARAEQEAVLGDFLDHEPEWVARLEEVLACNALLRARGGQPTQRAVVASIDPLEVPTEEGDTARVTGFPEQHRSSLRPGDTLMGAWRSGHFEASAWIPLEALASPASP